ncbi:McrB family protein [Paenibacillus jiagnxiensis]|uniref:McrB family protein n=1 Tax=Paenibacillus jiagnxiensis TaxID=3228926 RepID=UPI0033B33567
MINNLRVSLTKYGVREIIPLLKNDQLENFLNGLYTPSRSIDMPQISAALGTNIAEDLPTYWTEIRPYTEQLGAFCLTAVIFSHIELINVFENSGTELRKGIIKKVSLSEKVFTNLRGLMVDSGVSPQWALEFDKVPYDFSDLLSSGEVGLLVMRLLRDRLAKIGWNEPTYTNQEFYRNFLDQCKFYGFHKVFNIPFEEFSNWMNGQSVKMEETSKITFRAGWETETRQMDSHLAVSLSTKPFLIITGSSGTGKTYGVRKLAAALNPTDDPEFNLTFIAVEAGWKDGRHLVGYRNPFGSSGEVYQPTPLINMLLKANSKRHQNIPFFVLFDEMNLSHVEMYFAKFLSLMETSRHRGLHAHPLLSVADLDLMLKYYENNHEFTSYILEAKTNNGLFVPPNIFFVRTVNIDETTYMFSLKVLDRAFVIEKNTLSPITLRSGGIDFNCELSLSHMHEYLIGSTFEEFRQGFVGKDGYETVELGGQSTLIPSCVLEFLEEVYFIMRNFPFGYRVVIECSEYYLKAKELYYCSNETISWLNNDNRIFDEILLQKILPKMHGNRKQLSKTLKEIESLCKLDGNIRFPKTLAKIESMEVNLMTLGYSGFVC